MMKFPQANWVETSIVDDVTDKITGLPEIGPGSRKKANWVETSILKCVLFS
jgi:hypothetical protein